MEIILLTIVVMVVTSFASLFPFRADDEDFCK